MTEEKSPYVDRYSSRQENSNASSMEDFIFDDIIGASKNNNNTDSSHFLSSQENKPSQPTIISSNASQKINNLKLDEAKHALIFEQKRYEQKERKLKKEIEQLNLQIEELKRKKLPAESYHSSSVDGSFSPFTDLIYHTIHKIIPEKKPGMSVEDVINPLSPFKSILSADNNNYNPETPIQKRNYASGIIIGKDIKMMKERYEILGITTDYYILQAGIRDYLSDRTSLSEGELSKIIDGLKKDLDIGVKKLSIEQREIGNNYRKRFSKMKNVYSSSKNFLYRIDKNGIKKGISNKKNVSIIVTEILPDGTIVSDMAQSGSIISQPFEQYPPLFREAIRLTGTGGEITIVVPPEMAYGDAGKAPLIPPGSTIIYQIRILTTL